MESKKMKPYVVQLDGGIGRIICATSAIEILAKERKVIVLTSYPEIFWNNPNIYKVYSLSREYLWDDVIRHGEFRFPEPYYNHLFYNQKQHLIQSFDMLLNGGDGRFYNPKIYLSSDEVKWASDFIATRKKESGKDIAMLQCFGSTARVEDGKTIDPSNRSLPVNVVNVICRNSNCIYINASHIPIDLANVWQQTFTLRQIFALTAHCDFVVSIDSFLMHLGAACNKVGIAFFGGTYPENLGYPNYKMVVRDGYPKSYMPNRFAGFIDENTGALDFSTEEIEQILKVINDRNFPTVEEVFPIIKEIKAMDNVKVSDSPISEEIKMPDVSPSSIDENEIKSDISPSSIGCDDILPVINEEIKISDDSMENKKIEDVLINESISG